MYRDQASLIETIPEVAHDARGDALISKETLVLTQISKRGSDRPANVVVRGLPPMGVTLRPQVKLVEGRMFRPGTSEIIVGRSTAAGFEGVAIGQQQRFAGRACAAASVFDGGKSGFDSRSGGRQQMMQAFRRTAYSVIVRLRDPGAFDALSSASPPTSA